MHLGALPSLGHRSDSRVCVVQFVADKASFQAVGRQQRESTGLGEKKCVPGSVTSSITSPKEMLAKIITFMCQRTQGVAARAASWGQNIFKLPMTSSDDKDCWGMETGQLPPITPVPILLRCLQKIDFPHKLGFCDLVFGRLLANLGIDWFPTASGIHWKLDLANPTHRWIVYGNYAGSAFHKWVRHFLHAKAIIVDSVQGAMFRKLPGSRSKSSGSATNWRPVA